MEFLLEQFITGLSIGSILLIVALGLSIIYGSMGVINMAHGEFIMLGAYGAWALKTFAGIGLFPALVVIFIATALLGAVIERGVIRYLYRRPIDTILATWGIGVMLQQLVRLAVGGELRYVEMPPSLAATVNILGVDVSAYRVFIIIAGAVLFAGTWLLVNKTAIGMQLRAVMQDRSIATAFGINAAKIYTGTFAYGAGLAGLAGALVAPLKSVSPEMGTGYVVDAFFVVVLGGVQSLFGTVASSVLLGQLSGILAFWQNDTVAKALVLVAIVILIRFRPQGLLNRFARYLVLAMVSMALALSWGYAGILNLGQAMSFGLGSYCMAMALKLRTIPVHTGSEGLPDFMVWNNVEALPWFWKPFYSMPFAIAAGILVPVIVSAILAWFMFRGRVTGVYVAIITLATLVVVNLVIIDQQWATGGFNGITDLAQLELFGITFDAYSATTYYLIAICLTVCLFLALAITKSKAGLILQAIRDQEARVRFFGYDVALFKTMVFCVSAGIAGLAGMLYTIVMEFASPTFLGVQISLSIVVWCAVGGRQSLVGALLGAILVAGMQGALSESEVFLDTWTLVMGALFVLVVLFLPNGIASLGEKLLDKSGFLRRPAAQKIPGTTPKAGNKRMAARKLVEGQ